jgi:hypothetical protein
MTLEHGLKALMREPLAPTEGTKSNAFECLAKYFEGVGCAAKVTAGSSLNDRLAFIHARHAAYTHYQSLRKILVEHYPDTVDKRLEEMEETLALLVQGRTLTNRRMERTATLVFKICSALELKALLAPIPVPKLFEK